MGAGGHGLARAAHGVAVVEAGRRAVVSRGEDALVLDEEGAYVVSQARRALGYDGCDLHEVLIESGADYGRHSGGDWLSWLKNVTSDPTGCQDVFFQIKQGKI